MMNTKRFKLFVIILFAVPLLFAAFRSEPVKVAASAPDDAAAVYKAKCAACHGPAAAKWFDTNLSDEELVQAILKGKKGEKPPYMPEFASKGITEETAKALVAHMRSLRTPSN
jgi:mono/diheme cytochrome c family protein